MKKKIYLKNSIYSVVNYVLLVILGFAVRKVLIQELSITYAGYEALFTDIFALFHIADLGMDSIISYKLYEKLNGNKEEINNILAMANRIYGLIAIIVFAIGIAYAFFIPYIFDSDKCNINLIIFVYSVQVINLSIAYLTGYKRLLLIADQKEYVCLQWDSAIMIGIQVSRIVILLFYQSYYMYIALCIVQTLIQNIGINIKCSKEYPQYTRYKKIRLKDCSDIKKDMGNFLCHKVSAAVYSATDNIVITGILGLTAAGLYSNYYMISKYTYSFATKVMKPLQASIGNYLHSEQTVVLKYELLKKLDRMAFYIGIFVCNSLIQLSTPFIKIWLGEEYIQSNKLVILLAFNYYIAINQDFIFYYRNSYGQYEYDKKYMLMSAISNVILSILLGRKIGVEGVALATIVGHIFIWYGRVRFVYNNILCTSARQYWINQGTRIIILMIQIYILRGLRSYNWTGLLGCIYKEITVLVMVCATICIGERKNILQIINKQLRG